MNFFRDLKQDPQTTGLCSPHKSAPHPPTSYLLPKCSQKPRFCQCVLKATHPLLRFSGREASLGGVAVTIPSVCHRPIPRLLEIQGLCALRQSLGSACVQCEQCVLERLCEQCDRGFRATQAQPSWLGLIFSEESIFPPPRSSRSPWLAGKQQDGNCTEDRRLSVGFSHLNPRPGLQTDVQNTQLALRGEGKPLAPRFRGRTQSYFLLLLPHKGGISSSCLLSHLKAPIPSSSLHTRPIATFRIYSASTFHKPSQCIIYCWPNSTPPPPKTLTSQSLEPNVIK